MLFRVTGSRAALLLSLLVVACAPLDPPSTACADATEALSASWQSQSVEFLRASLRRHADLARACAGPGPGREGPALFPDESDGDPCGLMERTLADHQDWQRTGAALGSAVDDDGRRAAIARAEAIVAELGLAETELLALITAAEGACADQAPPSAMPVETVGKPLGL